MKNFKRIISFVMAMIICASFLLVNSGALLARYVFDENKRFFSPTHINQSYGNAYISNWGENEEDNDLVATTYIFYDGIPNCYGIGARVGVSIVFDDYFTRSGYSDIVYLEGAETIMAVHTGGQYDDFDHCVIGFTTAHAMYVTQNINGYITDLTQYGNSIYITTSS